MAELSGVWTDWVNDPRIIWIDAPRTEISIQDLVDTIRGVLEYDMGALDDPVLISEAAGKQFLGGTVYVGLTLELNNAVVAFEARTVELTDGYITAADPLGRTLTDAYATFITSGVTTGDLIYNHTDNSKSTILSVRSETELITTPLTGGVTNQYNIDDLYDLYDIISCEVSGGNLVSVDYDGYNIEQVLPTFGTRVKITASSSATQIENSAIQYSSYQNAVWVDPNATHTYATGTEYPAGTREYPTNNLTDAVAIAYEKGFDALQILDNMTLDSGTNISGFEIVGKSHVNTIITISSSAICNNITISNANVLGVLDGGTHIRDCMVGNITYVNGHIHDSGLYGTIVLGGGVNSVLMNCSQVDPNLIPIINMNGSGQDCVLANWSGSIEFQNSTSVDNKIDIQVFGGRITLDSTITAGDIVISGIGILEDNSTGTTTVNTDGLMSKETITDISFNTVWIDTESGMAGTTFPVGTQSSPVDNILDAYAIATARNIHAFNIRGSITLNTDYVGWRFKGLSSLQKDIIDIDGYDISDSFFELLQINGTMGGTNAQFKECYLVSVSNLSGIVAESAFQGTITLGPIASGILGTRTNCVSDPTIFDMNGPGRVLKLATAGDIKLLNSSTSCDSTFGMAHGSVEIDSSCTAGLVNVSGICRVIDNSGSGCLVLRDAQLDSSPGAYSGIINIDVDNGVTGSTYPNGTLEQPVNNIADAYAIAVSVGVRAFKVRGEITLDRDYMDWDFIGNAVSNSIVNLDGYNISNSDFKELTVDGIIGGTQISFYSCFIKNVSNMSGILNACAVEGPLGLGGIGSTVGGANNYVAAQILTIDAVGPARVLSMSFGGPIKLINMSSGAVITLGMSYGSVEIDSSCVDGFVFISGICDVIDNSGPGCTVINNILSVYSIDAYQSLVHGADSWEGSGSADIIAQAVWDEYRAGHAVPGTFGGDFSTAGATAAEIDAYLSVNHGAGNWEGTGGLTVEDIDAYLSINHGDGNWEGSGDPGAVADAVWDELRSGHTTVGTFGGDFSTAGATAAEIDAYLSTNHGDGNWEGSGDPGAVADAVWDEFRSGHTTIGTFGGDFSTAGATAAEIDAYLSTNHGAGNWEGSGDPSVIAAAVWDAYLVDHTIMDTMGIEMLRHAYGEIVHIDVVNGEPGGISSLVGTHLKPVNNLSDAKDIAAALNLTAFCVVGPLTIAENVNDYTFDGEHGVDSIITLATGCSTRNATFTKIIVEGEFNGRVFLRDCKIGAITNFAGFAFDCLFTDDVGILHTSQPSGFFRCMGSGPLGAPIEVDVNSSDLLAMGWKGYIKIINKDGNNITHIEMVSGEVAIENTCIAGDIVLRGVGDLTSDDSGPGCTVDASSLIGLSSISNTVWSETLPAAFAANSSGERLATIDGRIDQSLSATEDNIRGSDNRDLTDLAGTGFVSATDSLAAADDDRTAIKADTAAILIDTSDMQPKIGAPITGTLAGDIAAMIAQLTRVLGLEHENAFIDNTVNDDYGQLTSSRVRIFNSKANAEAATDGGSETTGLIATYTVTAVYEAVGRLKSYRMVKE